MAKTGAAEDTEQLEEMLNGSHKQRTTTKLAVLKQFYIRLLYDQALPF